MSTPESLKVLYLTVFGQDGLPHLDRWQQAEELRGALGLSAAAVLPPAFAAVDEDNLMELLQRVLPAEAQNRLARAVARAIAARAVVRVEMGLGADLEEVQQILRASESLCADPAAARRVRALQERHRGAPWQALRVLEWVLNEGSEPLSPLTMTMARGMVACDVAGGDLDAEERQIAADIAEVFAGLLDGRA